MAKCLDVAILMDRGLSYQAILEHIGISMATISRVSKNVDYDCGVFRSMLNRLRGEKKT